MKANNKTNNKPVKSSQSKKSQMPILVIFDIVELIMFLTSFITFQIYAHNNKIAMFYTAIAFLITAFVVIIVNLIIALRVRHYSLEFVGKDIIYKKLNYSETKTKEKHKKYTMYSVNKKDIESVERKGIFYVINGNITQKDLEGIEIKNTQKIEAIKVPYFVAGNKLKNI